MAERDRYDVDRYRNRDYMDRDSEYGSGRDRERGGRDRGMMARGSDEVRSWFGDEDAQRRREMDEGRDRYEERSWGRTSDRPGPERHAGEHVWSGAAESAFDSDYSFGAPNWSGAPRRESRDFSRVERGGYSGGYPRQDRPRYAGGTFAGRGPRNYQRSDERIREDINECLTADPRIDASDMEVRVQSGEVTLTGTVDARKTRRLAEEVIENLPGVRDVRNELRVPPAPWDRDAQQDRGRESRGRDEGALGKTGDPQKRDDVTTLNAGGTKNNR
ncbi:MAG: BON domain-containing protein [Vicinamibacterales bacterium]